MGKHGWESELGGGQGEEIQNGENGGLGEVVQLPTLREGEEMEGPNGKPGKWVGIRETKQKKGK